MNAKVVFLGTGGSAGIPVVGCTCAVCRSTSYYNKRLRPSILIQHSGKNFLVDATPDLRQQALKWNIDYLNGLLLTHAHNDHIGGLCDCAPYLFKNKQPIPLLLSTETMGEVKKHYHYLFSKNLFQLNILKKDQGEVFFEGLKVGYFSYFQKKMRVNGFRFKNFAYVTDITEYDPTLIKHLKGVDILVISGTLFFHSEAHIHFSKALKIAEKAQIKQTLFTHISHDIDHEKENKKLPQGADIAYDGLTLEVEIETAT